MNSSTIVLFGEAEKGDFETPHYCTDLESLFTLLGQPPEATQGLHFAVRSLLYGYHCIYFRVSEEGVSVPDYSFGLEFLHKSTLTQIAIRALGLPGIGDQDIIEESLMICKERDSLLLMDEKDFYDWLTDKK